MRALRGVHRCRVVEQLLPVLVSAAHTVQRVLQQGQEQQELKVHLQLVVTCHSVGGGHMSPHMQTVGLASEPPPPPSH